MTRSAPSTRPRRRAGAVVRAVVVGAVVSGLTACGAVDRLVSPGRAEPRLATTSSPAPPGPAVPSVDTVRATGTPVAADGAVVLHVLPTEPSLQVGVQPGDDATVVRLDPGDPLVAFDVLLAAPPGASLVPQDDDSVVVLADDGGFVGGMGRPTVGPGAPPTQLTSMPDGVLRLSVSGPVSTEVGAHALVGAEWGQREGGRSLAVEPTPWARTAGQAGEVGTWTELVRAVPEAGTATMRDQLTCHALGAPDKATWNLEPWRPDIGLLMTLAASCNAT